MRSFVLALVLGVLASQPALAGGRIVVFAAASLTNAMQDIASAYEAQAHVRVVDSFASSSTLARQIENGAPAQIFVSADTQWMDYLQKRGLIEAASRRNIAGNALVLIAPKSSPLRAIAVDAHLPWTKLLAGARLAAGDPDHVPAGIYAKQALQHLGAWDEVSPHLAPAEDVRAALVYVDRGETPLGIVYRTDALQDPKVRILGTFAPRTHAPIVYPLALVKGAGAPARAYFEFLAGKTALAILTRYGFTHAD